MRLLGGEGKGAMGRKAAGVLFSFCRICCGSAVWQRVVGISHLPTLPEVGNMTMEKSMVAKLVDSKGRIVLDKSYAGATMLVDQRQDGTIVLRPAVTVPADEAWLWKNKKALDMVQEGLAEARQGRHVAAPDLGAA